MTIGSWHIEFARPLWFAVLAVLPLLVVYWRWSLVRVSAARRIVSLLLRALLLLAVAAALAGPSATRSDNLAIVASAPPLPVPPPPGPAAKLAAPDRVRAGEPFQLALLIESQAAGKAKVEWARDAEPPAVETLSLVKGANQARLPAIAPAAGRVVYTARVTADPECLPAGAEAACAFEIAPRPRALLVESQPVLAQHLTSALKAENIDVVVRPPAELPDKPEALSEYAAVILANVPASAMPNERQDALRRYVCDFGGGLIVVGGEQAFTAGRYRRSVLEEALPVLSDPRADKPKPSLAMVLVVDVSGSMSQRSIELAKEALRRAVAVLAPRDQVGVLVFEDTSHWIVPLGPVADKEGTTAKIAKIATIKAEDGTNMYPPLEQAYLALRESYADLKHIIVMTDGVCTPGDFDALARRIADAGITMSTVGMGDEPVEGFLRGIAEKAKGRTYLCKDAAEVPRIFEMDTGVASKVGITEEPCDPQVEHATQALRGLGILATAPTLQGYVETQRRPESHVVLAAKNGDPILALWRYGRGTSAAFTSDIQNNWATAWLGWKQFPKFWVQLVRQTMRRDEPKKSRLTAEAADGRLWITLDAIDRDGRFINAAEVTATLMSPLPPEERGTRAAGRGEGKPAVVPLLQTAPGRYAAAFPIAGQGTYWLEGQIRSDGKLLDTVTCGTVVPFVPKLAAKPEFSFQQAKQPGQRTVYPWPWVLAAAMLVFLLDLAVKRTAGSKARDEG